MGLDVAGLVLYLLTCLFIALIVLYLSVDNNHTKYFSMRRRLRNFKAWWIRFKRNHIIRRAPDDLDI